MLCSWKSASSPAAAARRATAKLDFSDDYLGDDHLVDDGDDLNYHDDATMISTRCCDIQVNRL